MMALRTGSTAGEETLPMWAGSVVAVLLARIVIPLWLLIGGVLKWLDGSPANLPVALVQGLGGLGVDLVFVLQFSIAVELVVVGVMWLLPGLARPVGIAMLAAFVPILVADVLMGASSCGCFGAVQVHPAVSMTVDLAFLFGLWWWGRGVPRLETTDVQPTRRVVAAGLWTLASFAVAFGLASPGATAATASSGASMALPAEGYYMPKYDAWMGRPWSEIPLAAWIRGAPEELDAGTHYILFYRKDCEHCHELMEAYFSGPLTWPTTAVAVPERGGFPTTGVQPFVCDECSTAELPAGIDWFIATPALIRLSNGVVDCAAEVSAANPVCLEW
jgi:hypothetical protein